MAWNFANGRPNCTRELTCSIDNSRLQSSAAQNLDRTDQRCPVPHLCHQTRVNNAGQPGSDDGVPRVRRSC